MRTTVLRRTAAAVLLSAAAFGLAACTNAQAPATTYPSQSYGNPPSTAVTTTMSTPSGNPSGTETTTPVSPADGSSMASPPAGAQTTTP